MKIMVIGSGGREHALAIALSKDPKVDEVLVSPGNAGIARSFRCIKPVDDSNASYLQIAAGENVDLVVVGPEVPLVNGLATVFNMANIKCFGPDKEAALYTEGSKIFCKEILLDGCVPTAKFYIPDSAEEAYSYIDSISEGDDCFTVIKADGLCAGKGVFVCSTTQEAYAAVKSCMEDKVFGVAGEKIIIEKRLFGYEASFMVITNGQDVVRLLTAQDYKHEFDNNKGLMTGGMGAYAPTQMTDELTEQIMLKIVYPFILDGLGFNGIDYRGVLYFGLMITEDGPKVLEVNCRFGDPEIEVILPLLDTSLVDLMLWAIDPEQKPSTELISWKKETAVGVVLASPGYPGTPEKNKEISGLEEAYNIYGTEIYYAGVKASEDEAKLLTNGGRVLIVVATGNSQEVARESAYYAASKINFDGGIKFRTDIAK